MRLEEAEDVRVRPSGRAPRLFQFEKVAGEHFEAGADRSLGTLEVPRRGAAIFRCSEDAFFLERGKGWIRSYFQIWDAERAWLGEQKEWLLQYCQRKVSQGITPDYFIFGHQMSS